MGLFELSSWGDGGNKERNKKKHSQKRKKFQDKEKGNILKSKKKKFDLTIKNNSPIKMTNSPKNEKLMQKNKKKLQQNKQNPPTANVNKIMKKQLLSSKISHETLPIMTKKLTFLGIKGPVLEKKKNLQNQNNKKQTMKIKKKQKKFIKREKNLQTEKLGENLQQQEKLTISTKLGKKEKKRTQITSNIEIDNRKRSKFEDFEEIIESKRRKKLKDNNSNFSVIGRNLVVLKTKEENLKSGKNQLNEKINVNRLKGMLEDKQKEKKKRKWDKSLSLRERMMAQLRSSRFRFINETLYNNASFESKKYFKDDPDAFNAYHEGFQQQVDNWPLNPVDIIIESIKKMPKDYIVADFGCGEAKIAESVSQKVHSFDFVALNEKVTVCDMAHTPLLKSGVNIVVFCLSLMGTNLNDYLFEANRVLKKGGIMKIAEVESRFENIEDFIKLVTSYGFVNTWADISNDLFYFLDFKKEKDIENGKKKLPAIELKPCLYKRR